MAVMPVADPTPSEVEAALAVIEAAAHVHPAAAPVVAPAPVAAPAPAEYYHGADDVNFPPVTLDGVVFHRNEQGGLMLGPTG